MTIYKQFHVINDYLWQKIIKPQSSRRTEEKKIGLWIMELLQRIRLTRGFERIRTKMDDSNNYY